MRWGRGKEWSPPAAPSGYRDINAFAAIITALAATGEFADVVLGGTIDQEASGAARVPLAAIVPGQWTESDDVDPCSLVRHVVYQLVILVRDEDSIRAYLTT